MSGPVEELRKLAIEAAKESQRDNVQSCWPFMHRWGRWVPKFQGSAFQRRQCKRCGLTKEREV